MTLKFAGRFEEAILLTKKAMRLHPYYPTWYLFNVATPAQHLGKYEEAIPAYKKIIERQQNVGEPHLLAAHISLASIYGEIRREEEARAHLEEVVRLRPEGSSLEYWRNFFTKRTFYKDPAHVEQILDGLHKAGLQD